MLALEHDPRPGKIKVLYMLPARGSKKSSWKGCETTNPDFEPKKVFGEGKIIPN